MISVTPSASPLSKFSMYSIKKDKRCRWECCVEECMSILAETRFACHTVHNIFTQHIRLSLRVRNVETWCVQEFRAYVGKKSLVRLCMCLNRLFNM